MGDLREKLENESYTDVSFMVINHQDEHSRLKHHNLRSRVPEDIPVYQQEEEQPDIWRLLKGNKDDFLIYDRCGRLVKHIELPYAFLQFNYVEDAIKSVYCENTCGDCKYQIPSDVCKTEEEVPAKDKVDRPHRHRHHHRHGHQQQEEAEVVDASGPNTDVHKKHHHHQGEETVAVGEVDVVRSEQPSENRAAESGTSAVKNKL